MTCDEIRAEWDAFIEYPDGSDKLYVTRASALIFARVIAKMAAQQEREACAKECIEIGATRGASDAAMDMADYCAEAIRARGEK